MKLKQKMMVAERILKDYQTNRCTAERLGDRFIDAKENIINHYSSPMASFEVEGRAVGEVSNPTMNKAVRLAELEERFQIATAEIKMVDGFLETLSYDDRHFVQIAFWMNAAETVKMIQLDLPKTTYYRKKKQILEKFTLHIKDII